MDDICLSLAATLRCQSLTKLEAGILLLPPGLEVFFCFGLVLARLGYDRKPIILAAEGFTYFALALIDALVHVVPNVGISLQLFRPLDIFIGTASFIPVLLYTLFLLLYTNSGLLPILPIRPQAVVKYSLLLLIPTVITLNQIDSFFSISYRTFGFPQTVAVGFTNKPVHIALDILTLALLSLYQGIHLCVAFHRLNKAFQQRRSTPDGNQVKTHLFHGLLWIIAGLLLGTVESLIGFVTGGFAVVITRRVLRFIGRACLIIGVINGVDRVEDFHIFRSEDTQSRRRSMLRALISNPRNSTFVQLGGHNLDPGNAGAPSQMAEMKPFTPPLPGQRTPRSSMLGPYRLSLLGRPAGPTPAPFLQRTVKPDAPVRASLRPCFTDDRREERVTVHYTPDDTPVLYLRRFSDLSLRKALMSIEVRDPVLLRTKSMPLLLNGHKIPTTPVPTLADAMDALPGTPPATASTMSTIPTLEPAVILTACRAHPAHCRHTVAGAKFFAEQERDSYNSDSIEVVHALAVQFPETPSANAQYLPRPGMDIAHKPPPFSQAAGTSHGSSASGPVDYEQQTDVSETPWNATLDVPLSRLSSTHKRTSQNRRSTLLQDVLEYRMFQRATFMKSAEASVESIVDMDVEAPAVNGQAPENSLPTPVSIAALRSPEPSHSSPHTSAPTNLTTDPEVQKTRSLAVNAVGAIADSDMTDDNCTESPSTVMRIKSVGCAPRHLTPNPRFPYTRDSIAVEMDVTSAKKQEMTVVDVERPWPIKVRRKLHRQSVVGDSRHEPLGVARRVA